MTLWFKKPASTRAQTLVDATLGQLPLPPTILAENSSKALDDPSELLMLANAYANQNNNTAWIHFFGELIRLKDMYERMILLGERDRFGNDLSAPMRASYGTLLQILAIPAQVQKLHKDQEASIMGLPQMEKIDFSQN